MSRRSFALLLLFALTLALSSCAVSGPDGANAPAPRSMSAARQSLAPEFRGVYDELSDYGQWTLVEPYGFVFRPTVNAVAWRPYDDGYWEASDLYGWVWISNEPIGWITYHYGNWFYDRFQGWVWAPGYQWGPAWVAWVQADDYYGWAPLPPSGFDRAEDPPTGLFSYTTAAQLASGAAMPLAQSTNALVGREVTTFQPVLNLGRADGVTYNRGPSIREVERASARIVPLDRAGEPRVVAPDRSPNPVRSEEQLVASSRRMFEAARRELEAAKAGRGAAASPRRPPPPRPPVRTEPAAPAVVPATDASPSAADSLRSAPDSSAHARVRIRKFAAPARPKRR